MKKGPRIISYKCWYVIWNSCKHLQKPGFPKPEPCLMEHNLYRLVFRILHAIFCFVLLSTSLLYNANVASSSVAYHKRRLKLFAAALTTTELMSAYYKCIYKHKMIFGTDHAVATDTTKEDSKILKTEQNVNLFFLCCPNAIWNFWSLQINFIAHGKRKVGNPCSSAFQTLVKATSPMWCWTANLSNVWSSFLCIATTCSSLGSSTTACCVRHCPYHRMSAVPCQDKFTRCRSNVLVMVWLQFSFSDSWQQSWQTLNSTACIWKFAIICHAREDWLLKEVPIFAAISSDTFCAVSVL